MIFKFVVKVQPNHFKIMGIELAKNSHFFKAEITCYKSARNISKEMPSSRCTDTFFINLLRAEDIELGALCSMTAILFTGTAILTRQHK